MWFLERQPPKESIFVLLTCPDLNTPGEPLGDDNVDRQRNPNAWQAGLQDSPNDDGQMLPAHVTLGVVGTCIPPMQGSVSVGCEGGCISAIVIMIVTNTIPIQMF